MIKRFTIYLNDGTEPSEMEEIYPEAFAGVPEEEKINVIGAINDVGYELGVKVYVNTTTGEHTITGIDGYYL